VEDIYPLSHLQEGILYHTLYDPESGVYFEQLNLRLKATLDARALEYAWKAVIDRHPVFRTGFVWQGLKKPVQVVHRDVHLPIAELDFRGLTAVEQEKRLAEYLIEERRNGFDLLKPPLMHVTLCLLGDDDCSLIWSHHHILLDGWCVQIVLKEVFSFYFAYLSGEDLHLALAGD
jgi:hypothetical protein